MSIVRAYTRFLVIPMFYVEQANKTKEEIMAKCSTCGKTIRIPKGWSIGPAVRRHYWAKHRERMERGRADRAAESLIGKH
ncbi:MAG: hypothetical protein ABIS18_00655 [Actinomycetota bacterium]